jgi:hypothetical protein
MNTGVARAGLPTAGAWVTYGLGSENRNLPGFVVLGNNQGIKGGPVNWGAGFLPTTYQGTLFRSQGSPVLNLKPPKNVAGEDQRAQLELMAKLNQRHRDGHGGEPDLTARIQSFELAYRMQMEAADAFDISKEPQHVREMYGDMNSVHARQTLIARRLLERGVRFVQLWHGASQPWDNHDKIKENHEKLARQIDQPIAALIKDLKQRGLLDETLVVVAGEFGRTPLGENRGGSKNVTGRDHHPSAFTILMAGGGLKGGLTYGETDEIGWSITQDPVHINDLHATMLHLFGLDHLRLTHRFQGRDYRLTDVAGTVVKPWLA